MTVSSTMPGKLHAEDFSQGSRDVTLGGGSTIETLVDGPVVLGVLDLHHSDVHQLVEHGSQGVARFRRKERRNPPENKNIIFNEEISLKHSLTFGVHRFNLRASTSFSPKSEQYH